MGLGVVVVLAHWLQRLPQHNLHICLEKNKKKVVTITGSCCWKSVSIICCTDNLWSLLPETKSMLISNHKHAVILSLALHLPSLWAETVVMQESYDQIFLNQPPSTHVIIATMYQGGRRCFECMPCLPNINCPAKTLFSLTAEIMPTHSCIFVYLGKSSLSRGRGCLWHGEKG